MAWQDFPSDVGEMVLDCLPFISDRVRFAAVCRSWRSIQRDHRRRRAPSPLPLLISAQQHEHEELDTVVSYSPLERRFYRFHLPSRLLDAPCLCSSHGWLLLSDHRSRCKTFTFVNPVSGAQIRLPPLPVSYVSDFPLGCASSPPDDPSCCVMVSAVTASFLWRGSDREWVCAVAPGQMRSIVFCRGRFYCSLDQERIAVVDPSVSASGGRPRVDVYSMWRCKRIHQVMEWSDDEIERDVVADSEGTAYGVRPWPRMNDEREWDVGLTDGVLVESDEDVLLVEAMTTGEMRVLKPNFRYLAWSRVESLGGRALFLGENCSVAVEAAGDIQGDCIYFLGSLFGKCNEHWACKYSRHPSENWGTFPWMKYDLKTGRIFRGQIPKSITPEDVGPMFLKCSLRWMFPTL